VVIARGTEKESFAKELGAHHYIDSTATNVAEELLALGGARVVQATAADAKAMADTIDGLGPNGELLVLGVVPEPLAITPLQLIPLSKTVHGHPGGTAMDVEQTMKFAALHGIRAMVEDMPLEDAAKGYDRMLSNTARFRVVLTTRK
jgi:alcohol dehydrogenase